MKSASVRTLRSMVWLLILPILGAVWALLRPASGPAAALRVEALPYEVLSVQPEPEEHELEPNLPETALPAAEASPTP